MEHMKELVLIRMKTHFEAPEDATEPPNTDRELINTKDQAASLQIQLQDAQNKIQALEEEILSKNQENEGKKRFAFWG